MKSTTEWDGGAFTNKSTLSILIMSQLGYYAKLFAYFCLSTRLLGVQKIVGIIYNKLKTMLNFTCYSCPYCYLQFYAQSLMESLIFPAWSAKVIRQKHIQFFAWSSPYHKPQAQVVPAKMAYENNSIGPLCQTSSDISMGKIYIRQNKKLMLKDNYL